MATAPYIIRLALSDPSPDQKSHVLVAVTPKSEPQSQSPSQSNQSDQSDQSTDLDLKLVATDGIKVYVMDCEFRPARNLLRRVSHLPPTPHFLPCHWPCRSATKHPDLIPFTTRLQSAKAEGQPYLIQMIHVQPSFPASQPSKSTHTPHITHRPRVGGSRHAPSSWYR